MTDDGIPLAHNARRLELNQFQWHDMGARVWIRISEETSPASTSCSIEPTFLRVTGSPHTKHLGRLKTTITSHLKNRYATLILICHPSSVDKLLVFQRKSIPFREGSESVRGSRSTFDDPGTERKRRTTA
jgi:hypothetical protein